MAPTSDERREVAATLRDAKRKCDERGYPWMTDDLCLAIGYEHDYEADNGIFDRLADLIDPTCHRERKHVVVDDYRRDTLILPVCSACGFVFDKRMPKPNFCPECGARLVSDDG
ncbi:MAG: hypothetical protein SOZ36_05620 [Atopobiaceae bacterium]|nr:hypothetical protein [Atopobiaceae bacterium]